MAVDPAALKAAFQTVARLAKLSLTVVATAVLVSMTNTGGFDATDSAARQQGRMGERLRQAIMFIPSPSGDIIVRQVCLPLFWNEAHRFLHESRRNSFAILTTPGQVFVHLHQRSRGIASTPWCGALVSDWCVSSFYHVT